MPSRTWYTVFCPEVSPRTSTSSDASRAAYATPPANGIAAAAVERAVDGSYSSAASTGPMPYPPPRSTRPSRSVTAKPEARAVASVPPALHRPHAAVQA